MKKPNKKEYPFVYQKYIDLVGEGSFIELLDENTEFTISFFKSINEKDGNYKYAENKWSIKDVLMHIIDTERSYSFRAIVCVRNDKNTPLYKMDEEFYAKNVDVSNVSIEDLIKEFIAVREAFKFIFINNKKDFKSLGNGVGYQISARALGYIAIGHVKHHCSVIKQKYLV